MLPQRRRHLRTLYARLYGQLDQRAGREKHILRRYVHALAEVLSERKQTHREGAKEKEEDRDHA